MCIARETDKNEEIESISARNKHRIAYYMRTYKLKIRVTTKADDIVL